MCQGKQGEEARPKFKELYLLLSCSLQCHLLKLHRCLSQSWCLLVGRVKGKHWSWDITTSAERISKEQPRDSYMSLSNGRRQKHGEDKVGGLINSTYGTQDASHIWKLDSVSLICGELGGFRRGKRSAALFHNSNDDVRMAVHSDDFVFVRRWWNSITSTHFSNQNTQRKTWEHLDSKIRMRKVFCFWTACSESGQSTPREQSQEKLVLDGRKSPILEKEDAKRYRSACLRLSYLVQDRLDLAEPAKHLVQRLSKPREFDFVPLKRAARYLVGKPKAALRFRRQKHVDTITVLVDSDFADWWRR